MSLLNTIIGAAGTLLGSQNNAQEGASNPLINVVLGMITNNAGGLGGMLQQFQQAGLGDAMQSWIGTGENMPIQAEQLQQVFGHEVFANLAQQLGVSESQMGSQLSELLPQIVDRMTPNGELPSQNADLGALVSGLGDLLARR